MFNNFDDSAIDCLLKFNSLLRKKRSKKADDEIQLLLKVEDNIAMIVQKIEEIDKRNFNNVVDDQQEIPKKSNRKVINKKSLLYFLFYSRRNIMNFAKDTGVLVPSFFGLKYRLSEESVVFLESLFNESNGKYLLLLNKILNNGWEILDPLPYNTVYSYAVFNNIFVKKFNIDRDNISTNYDFIEAFNEEYLKYYLDTKYIPILEGAVVSYFGYNSSEDINLLLNFIRNSFSHKSKISLKNFILCTYSVYYREKLSLDDIIDSKNINPIEEEKFITNNKIRSQIQDYVNQIKSKMETMENKIFMVKYIKTENNNEIDSFIKNKYSPSFHFDYFKNDLIESCYAFLYSFINYSRTLLKNENYLIKDNEKKTVFIFTGVWDSFIENCDKFITDLSYMKHDTTHKVTLILLEKFLKNNKQLESQKEEKSCTLIHEVVMSLFVFFSGIIKLLYNDYRLTNYEDRENIISNIEMKTRPVTSLDGVPRFIPYSDYISDKYGETVLSILNKSAGLCGTFLYHINHPDVIAAVKNKDNIIEDYQKSINRLMKFK